MTTFTLILTGWLVCKAVLLLIRRAEELSELETDARAAEIRAAAKK